MKLTPSKEEVEKRVEELNQIAKILEKQPFFISPHISQEGKKAVLQKGLEGKIDPQLLSFLLLLIEKRRFKHLGEIAKAYSELAMEKLGKLKGCLTVPEPISDELKKNVTEALEKRYQKSLSLDVAIDPKLIGGGILRIGNSQADFSLKGKLAKLEKDLLSINV